MDLSSLRHSLNSSGESSSGSSRCSSRSSSRCNSRSSSTSRRGGGARGPRPHLALPDTIPVVSLASLRLDGHTAASPLDSPSSPVDSPIDSPLASPLISPLTTIPVNPTPDTKPQAEAGGGTPLPLMQCGSLAVCAERLRRSGMESLSGKPQQRLSVLSFEQVQRLSDMMDEVVSIHGRGNFPTLEVRLRDLVAVVRSKLEVDMPVRDIRLNGGGASHVLASDPQPYNDLDLIFGVELTAPRNFERVKAAVLGSLMDLLPEGVSRKRITTCSLKEAYVSKMVKVNHDGDRWSLISLGNSRGHKNVELKFVDSMRRPFEFSVDSFQIVLDSLLLFYECSDLPISENFYPTVVGESVYGDFQEALYHLQKKLIATRCPEEIRGGGLLKYCNLLVRNYRPARSDMKSLERYMCSRFFIDFPDIAQQRAKLQSYLSNHFVGRAEEALRYRYLLLLRRVVEQSTVCLMGHERRQTLQLIEQLAALVLSQEQALQGRLGPQQAQGGPQPTWVYQNGYFYAPVIPSYTACSCSCNAPTGWMAACSS